MPQRPLHTATLLPCLLAVCCIWVQGHSYAQQKDSVLLTNNILVIGELKNIELGKMNFDADELGDVSVKLYKIKSLFAGAHRYRITSSNGQIYFGTVRPSAKQGVINITDGRDTTQLAVTQIVSLYYYESNFFKQLSGTFSIGFNFTRSKSQGTLNYDGSLRYAARKFEVNTTSSLLLNIDSVKTSYTRGSFQSQASYILSPRWTVAGLLSYQRNEELNISSRFQEGLGIGNKFLLRRNMQAKLLTGLVVNQEHSTDGTVTNGLYEIPLVFTWNFYQFSHPNLRIDVNQTGYIGLTQHSRFRVDGQLNISWELIKHLDLSLVLYNNYDNQPPGENAKKSDYNIVLGVDYSF